MLRNQMGGAGGGDFHMGQSARDPYSNDPESPQKDQGQTQGGSMYSSQADDGYTSQYGQQPNQNQYSQQAAPSFGQQPVQQQGGGYGQQQSGAASTGWYDDNNNNNQNQNSGALSPPSQSTAALSPGTVWGTNTVQQRGGSRGQGQGVSNPPSSSGAGTNLAGDYGQSGVGQNQTHNQNQFGMGGLGGGSGYNQPQQPNTSNSSNYDSGDMDGKNKAYHYGDMDDFSNEPPLLEELGIRFDHIWLKTLAVMYPSADLGSLSAVSKMSFANFTKYAMSFRSRSPGDHISHSVDKLNVRDLSEFDSDLTGPVIFCLIFGCLLLLSGRVHFGAIYGFSVCGCVATHQVLLLLATKPSSAQNNQDTLNVLDIWETCSILGYCLLPVIGLAALRILFSLRGFFGMLVCGLCIFWSTYSATRLFDQKMNLWMTGQFWLVAYPVSLLYATFTLITVF